MVEDFSVLLAVYKNDKPEFLNECLQSLEHQSVKPVSIILVKDGLVPNEIENVIVHWSNKLPLKVVGYEKNQGLAHALNYGIHFVETEYVARMDSDDICFSNRFEKQIRFIDNNTEVEICAAGISEFYIDKEGNETRKIRLYPSETDKNSKTLFKGTPIAHPTLFIKTELLKSFKYSENTSMNEDIDLWFRLILAGKTIYTLQEPLLNFRITDGTFKRRSISKACNEYKIYKKSLRELFGFSPLLIWPFIRLLTRFLPYKINKKLYFSKSREKLFKNK